MSIAAHIRDTLELPTMIVNAYLGDLTDDDLFIRPAENMNHIAWQLGHLIAGEKFHIEQLVPGSMPALPDGFREQHSAATFATDDRAGFRTKQEYLRLMQEQREGTLAVLDSMSDARLQADSPETLRYFGPTVGSVFSGEATHWMMHAGQWAVVRRMLGRPPLF
ncbi:MAG: DinB family protein [Planctomycetaceae bacterium]|nr:DinB family protein [Planctomycetaceae bacterium]